MEEGTRFWPSGVGVYPILAIALNLSSRILAQRNFFKKTINRRGNQRLLLFYHGRVKMSGVRDKRPSGTSSSKQSGTSLTASSSTDGEERHSPISACATLKLRISTKGKNVTKKFKSTKEGGPQQDDLQLSLEAVVQEAAVQSVIGMRHPEVAYTIERRNCHEQIKKATKGEDPKKPISRQYC